MALEDVDILDNIGIDKESGHVVLSIIDNLDWNNECQHLSLLQDKLNYYLGFIESNEIYVAYPKSKGREFEIFIYARYSVPEGGIQFLNKVKSLLVQSGYFFRVEEWIPELGSWKSIF